MKKRKQKRKIRTAIEMELCYLIGIDPGKQGGFAIIHSSNIDKIRAVYAFSKYSWRELSDTLNWYAKNRLPCYSIFEKVGPMPTDARRSLATFMRCTGIMEGILTALHIPVSEVEPVRWQRQFIRALKNEGHDARKRRLKSRAQQIYPKEYITLETADCILLARYLCLQRTQRMNCGKTT